MSLQTGQVVSYWNNIVANCDGNGTVTKSFVRTFTATDGCNETDCSITYTWTEESSNTQPTGPNYSNEGEAPEFVVIDEVTYIAGNEPQAQANDASQDLGVELDFMAYPVPFDRDVNVKFNFEFDTDVTIEVHDTRGLLVKSMTLK